MGEVTLVDSSVWIEFLRNPEAPADDPLAELILSGALATCDPIAMELLMGPTDELAVRRVERVLAGAVSLPLEPSLDFRAAAQIFRAVRRTGRTPRSIVDCLIAAVAIRHGAPLLHRDADFEAIAAVTELDARSLPGR